MYIIKFFFVVITLCIYAYCSDMSAYTCESDTDFIQVQSQYDRLPEKFTNSYWLQKLRQNTIVESYGGILILDNKDCLALSHLMIKVSGLDCNYEGIRVVLSDSSGKTIRNKTIDHNAKVFFDLPVELDAYPLTVSLPLLKKKMKIISYIDKLGHFSKVIELLKVSKLHANNQTLYGEVFLKWIHCSVNVDKNIFNKISELLQIFNHDLKKKEIICANQDVINEYVREIKTIDKTNPIYASFKNHFQCLLK
jgi:hypothetical protein